jgi:predicted ATPase
VLERALRGDRQVVFVTGEAGIGKTTVVNVLLDHAAAVPGFLIARGQCLEQYGAGEAYLPMLDGLSRLGRTPDGPRILRNAAAARAGVAPGTATVAACGRTGRAAETGNERNP